MAQIFGSPNWQVALCDRPGVGSSMSLAREAWRALPPSLLHSAAWLWTLTSQFRAGSVGASQPVSRS